MYSSYGEAPFLKDYFKIRSQIEAQLDEAHSIDVSRARHWLSDWRVLAIQSAPFFDANTRQKHLDCPASELSCNHISLDSVTALNPIPTEDLLRVLTSLLLQGSWKKEKEIYHWLSQLLRRFEVFKKLHIQFTPSFRKASDQFRLPVNYALLSIACLSFYEHTLNLKFLNGALKLNDLLCSIVAELDNPETRMITLIAIRKEKAMVQRLVTSKGIIL